MLKTRIIAMNRRCKRNQRVVVCNEHTRSRGLLYIICYYNINVPSWRFLLAKRFSRFTLECSAKSANAYAATNTTIYNNVLVYCTVYCAHKTIILRALRKSRSNYTADTRLFRIPGGSAISTDITMNSRAT